MSVVPYVPFEEVRLAMTENTVVWTSPSLQKAVADEFSCKPLIFPEQPSGAADTFIVLGGGRLIDYAKSWRLENAPQARLIAVSTIWGSGAENSPIAVLNMPEGKRISKDPRLLPDQRSHWPAAMASLSASQIQYACGDVWAHALEGFWSPLADDSVCEELAEVIREALFLPIGADERWFEVSARACACQARGSVGLVHGFAHCLEPLIPDSGHAQLCATFLWPVFRFVACFAEKPFALLKRHQLPADRIGQRLQALFDPDCYAAFLPVVMEHWKKVLRDPCTRLNSVLVRREHLEFFAESRFQ